jgi:ribonuclease-3
MCKTEKFLLEKYKQHELSKLETLLKYTFKDSLLLIKALSHPSLKQHDNLKKYFEKQKYEFEKLELLGDAVLGMIIVELLVDYYPRFNESMIAKFRNFLVSKKTIAKVASRIKLFDFWIMTDGEKKSGGNKNISNLENTLEALIGAIYLDSSDINIIKNVIKNLWLKHIETVNLMILDPKSSLQELSCVMDLGVPKYEIMKQEGLPNSPTFTSKVFLENGAYKEGCGKSKKEAEIAAAQKLLTLLSN